MFYKLVLLPAWRSPTRQKPRVTKLLWPGGMTCLKEVASPICSMPASWARSSDVSVMRMPVNLDM
ncbi:hypothetical protein DPMN_001599 [Dreissena polymorpha]|uniref:Uncharacterized protein n=1 Tax=Dreissena polymorpha TaxID=45954 RepID=A0A9D4RT14_DREPO|nr:hypothetical protein DPMN_001599 [Dreissena polymorpha]